MLTPVDLMTDAKLFASQFGGPSFAGWRVLLSVAFGLAHTLTRAEREIAERCTGLTQFPTRQVRELWLVVGRRGGKSLIAALIAVYLACFRKYVLAPGERGVLMVLAADRRQARVVKRYISGLLAANPMLALRVAAESKETITLTNGLVIEVHTSSFRAIRGYTVVGAVCDEIAFWRTDDSANPDAEVLNALRPAMATVPNALLIPISSPYARRGELWRAYHEHFGKPSDDVLVVQADTRTLNPTVPQSVIDKAYADDEAVASAEYGAQFRRDIESYIAREVIDACTIADRRELPPVSDVFYRAFVDPSGGGADSFTLAIAHHEKDRAVLDALRERKPPFSPEQVTEEFAALLRTYRVSEVTGDRYAGEWPREQFRKHGIEYRTSEHPKSDLYRELVPLLNSSRIELLDHQRLRSQFGSLERRTARGGRDSIDHAPKCHDDLANAAAGALVLAAVRDEPLIFR